MAGTGHNLPDVISLLRHPQLGKAHVIKSHHNVGGLPKEMKMGLVNRCVSCSKTKCA